ncbi:MAG: DUF4374 domain-containing protein [Mariniphaga sp.]|jgi:hypothetical protein|nr:DUF4374 domain-containing protein [Mariniphaga sp.]
MTIVMLASCSKENEQEIEEPEVEQEDTYVLITTPSFVSPVSYIQTINDLDVPEIDNSGAAEYLTAGFYQHKNMFFSCNYTDNFVVRFLIDENNKLVEDLKIDLGGTTGKIWFKDDNTAYTYETTGFQVKIFDPTQMVIKETIDLSMLKRDDVPYMELYDVVERDGKLFIPVLLSTYPHSTALDSIHIAIIDLPSSSLEKVIKTGISQSVGAGIHSRICMGFDENKDLYLMAHLSSGLGGSSKPSGLLRIKSGSTEFDPEYFWNMTEATGQHIAESFHYIGNGKAFITVGYKGLINPNNLMSPILDPVYKWWIADLNAKTVKELGLPATKGFNTSWVFKYGDDYLIPIGNNNEQAIYKYNPESEQVTGKIITNGLPITFLQTIPE